MADEATRAEASRDTSARPQAPGFMAEVRDAVSPRTVALVAGVLAIQWAFILS